MSRIQVRFQDGTVDLELPGERLVASWTGPAGVSSVAIAERLADRLEHPADFPALRQAVVPGDRVAIALGSLPSGATELLGLICDALKRAGVEPGDITVLSVADGEGQELVGMPDAVGHRTHDPGDRNQLAYLAATAEGRRIYLSRTLTDADFVLPVSELRVDPLRGIIGPWTGVFPGLSDEETRREFGSRPASRDFRTGTRIEGPELREANEVCWLLGCQFQVGLIPGVEGYAEVVAGLGTSVTREGALALERHWAFRAPSRADLVIVGVGAPGRPSAIEDVVRGLATATELVRRGGKVVVLSRAA